MNGGPRIANYMHRAKKKNTFQHQGPNDLHKPTAEAKKDTYGMTIKY